jgi:type I restriction-modification system DNA methylase subunit
MTTSNTDHWRNEFGIVSEERRTFFANKAELEAVGTDTAQSHVIRRAFDLLKLDGVLCTANAPMVYFKEVKRIQPTEVASLHQKFWNHGGAPILVLIAPTEVHVYSGLVRPVAVEPTQTGRLTSFVESMDRTSSAVQEFVPTVESGEFFRKHPTSFDPTQRVDRDLLDNLEAVREKLIASSKGNLDTNILDALLCRLVFACYLFDRKIIGEAYLRSIGLKRATHLRDVLAIQPRTLAKKSLYDLFRKLGNDFNGDLFSDNLDAEARLVSSSYLGPLDEFFRASNVKSGQTSFWPYDFSAIPVEAISAIYERFLKSSDKLVGAFYTPRFLAELVLDIALAASPTLLNQRYLDPACGSGIFLVGLFNRVAEEWKRRNPEARNDRRAKELRKILCNSLFGIDVNPTACRITAFSLYLAYLDQLSPRDIQELQEKGHKLPRLVHQPNSAAHDAVEGNIWCGDFFDERTDYPIGVDLVVGNPPWGSTAVAGTPAAAWCGRPNHKHPIPDKQISAAFIWKTPYHLSERGSICLVLPHGTIFNHNTTALEFQRSLLKTYAVEQIFNLVDYQFFLFEEARHPAIIVKYRKTPPANQHVIDYLGPKTDWLVTRAEVISVMPEDRYALRLSDVLSDLEGEDAPQIWKRNYWATARDRRLIERLSLYRRLRDHVRQGKESDFGKPWLIAEGFQPLGENDSREKAKMLRLTSRTFVEATSPHLNLFLLPRDCGKVPSTQFPVRRASDARIFRAPHVLVAKGFTSVAFAEFDVSFRHALRGICGPKTDQDLLVFLAAYLHSPLAKHFLFHTSSNWGVSRQEVHVEELLRLPFPLPDSMQDVQRAWQIVRDVSEIVRAAATAAADDFADRASLVEMASASSEPLIYEYFDLLPNEALLLRDTLAIVIPSVRPTRARPLVPTIEPSKQDQRDAYAARLCETLNSWTKRKFTVRGRAFASMKLGIGVAILQKSPHDENPPETVTNTQDVLAALAHLRKVASSSLNTFELIRGIKIFDRDQLYLVKPIGQRFWTETAALNDADDIAGTILMSSKEPA